LQGDAKQRLYGYRARTATSRPARDSALAGIPRSCEVPAVQGGHTAIPKQHITFNGVFDLPFGRGKRWLAGVNKWANEAVGGWEISGAGQVVSQAFAPNNGNWGATNPIKYY
jgi:hypothetical protein